MVRHHHERLDGHGYPDRLAGEQIPLGARIIAVADTFDAITSRRPYRGARTHKAALDILLREAGAQLDGGAIAAFLRTYSARRSIVWLALTSAASRRALGWLQTATPSLSLGAGATAPLVPTLGLAGALAVSSGVHPGASTPRRAQARAALTRVVHASTTAGRQPPRGEGRPRAARDPAAGAPPTTHKHHQVRRTLPAPSPPQGLSSQPLPTRAPRRRRH